MTSVSASNPMKVVTKSNLCCDAMMQEIAEASVESILTGLDTVEQHEATPDTPPNVVQQRDQPRDWYSPSATSTPFSTHPSWSFCETEASTSQAQAAQDSSTEQVPAQCIYESSEECGSQGDFAQIPLGMPVVGCTTVMLRNIPNKYTRPGLLAALVERGFDPTTDCNNLYLPMDAGSGCNLGYSFLNFTSHEKAMEFKDRFDGCRLPSAGSRKVCSVVWANKQGLFQHSNPPTSKEQTAPASALPAPIAEHGVPTCKIFVGGLPVTTTEADLVEYFSKFGHIREASIVVNRQTGASRGFGFCEFMMPDAVDRVQLAQAKKPHSINCRVVSVRPYNMTQYGSGSMDTMMNPMQSPVIAHPPQQPTMTFLMGNGMLHYPPTVASGMSSSIGPSAYGSGLNLSSSYGHPLLAPQSMNGSMGSPVPGYLGYAPGASQSQIHQHSFIPY